MTRLEAEHEILVESDCVRIADHTDDILGQPTGQQLLHQVRLALIVCGEGDYTEVIYGQGAG